jgi:pilus assembly protein CpaB
MKPKTLILMVVAIACGLGASYMTSRLLAERSEAAPADHPKVEVLVAKRNLDMGTFIKNPPDLFEVKQVAKGDEPKNAVVDYGVLKVKYMKRSLRAGDHVTPDDLADNGNGINWQLPEGHRAIGIRVNTEGIAGGWASLPGSRVDIISTIRGGSDDDSYAQVLLSDVLVLAADGLNRTREDGSAMLASVVTLALNADDALRVTLASQLGPLHLMLRKQGDKTKPDVERITQGQVKRGKTDSVDGGDHEQDPKAGPANASLEIPPIKAEEQAADAAKAEPVSRTHVMVIIEGEHQRKVRFQLGENDEVLSSDAADSEAKAPRPTPTAPPAPAPQQPEPAAQPNPTAPNQPAAAPNGKTAKGSS